MIEFEINKFTAEVMAALVITGGAHVITEAGHHAIHSVRHLCHQMVVIIITLRQAKRRPKGRHPVIHVIVVSHSDVAANDNQEPFGRRGPLWQWREH